MEVLPQTNPSASILYSKSIQSVLNESNSEVAKSKPTFKQMPCGKDFDLLHDIADKKTNLVHLLKSRKLSDTGEHCGYLGSSLNSEGDENSTDSSFKAKGSYQNSPIMASLTMEKKEPCGVTQKATKQATSTSLGATQKLKHSKFYCKAAYLAGPKMDQLPSLSF